MKISLSRVAFSVGLLLFLRPALSDSLTPDIPAAPTALSVKETDCWINHTQAQPLVSRPGNEKVAEAEDVRRSAEHLGAEHKNARQMIACNSPTAVKNLNSPVFDGVRQ